MSDFKDLQRVILNALYKRLPNPRREDPDGDELALEITEAVWDALHDSRKGLRRAPTALAVQENLSTLFIACDDGSIWRANGGGMTLYTIVPQRKVP